MREERIMEGFVTTRELLAQAYPKRSKYGAVRTQVDGLWFASKREAERYGELCLLERNGDIQALECQVRYPLVVNRIKVGTYVADFRFWEHGQVVVQLVVEDVKTAITKTRLYQMKRKLLLALYGITIKET